MKATEQEIDEARLDLELTLKAAEVVMKEELAAFWDFDTDEGDDDPHDVTDEEVLDELKSRMCVDDDGDLAIEFDNAEECEQEGAAAGGTLVYTVGLWIVGYEKNEKYVALLKRYDLEPKVKRATNVEDCGCEACSEKAEGLTNRIEELVAGYRVEGEGGEE